jgi:hypothetical protein
MEMVIRQGVEEAVTFRAARGALATVFGEVAP